MALGTVLMRTAFVAAFGNSVCSCYETSRPSDDSANVQQRRDCQKTQNPRITLAANASLRHSARLSDNLAATVILVPRVDANRADMGKGVPRLKSRKRLGNCPNKCSWNAPTWNNSPSFALCSGVLVDKDVVVAPRHCVCYSYGASGIRIHSANWHRDGDRSHDHRHWRDVTHVMPPMADDTFLGSTRPNDFVFLRLSDKIATPAKLRNFEAHQPADEDAYMVASPLGIPGTLTVGKVEVSSGPGPSLLSHSMYSAVHSSGGAIFDMNGYLLGVHVGPTHRSCSCPRIHGNELFFPDPNPDRKLGRYIGLSQSVIVKHLGQGTWMTFAEWDSARSNGSVCNGASPLEATSGIDWNC